MTNLSFVLLSLSSVHSFVVVHLLLPPINTSSSTSSNNSNATSGAPPSSAAAAAASINSAPRYPLSEFRYGREEMLALFDKNIKHPEILPRYKYLFVEKMQCPLALTPSAEDDQVAGRMWPMRSSPGLSARGGRGGIMDRGRGRGRGAYHSVSGGGFSRSSLFPDEEGAGRPIGRVSGSVATIFSTS